MIQTAVKYFPTEFLITHEEMVGLRKGIPKIYKRKVLFNDFLLMQKVHYEKICAIASQKEKYYPIELYPMGLGLSIPDIQKAKKDKWCEVTAIIVYVLKDGKKEY